MRYQAMVDLAHPAVQAIAAQLPTGCDRLAIMKAATAALKERFTYINVRGYKPIDDMLTHGQGNCLSLTVMLAAILRVAGYPPSAVHVGLGNYRGFWVENIHAWVLVQPEPGEMLWMIDPGTLTFRQVKRGAIPGEFNFIVLFNDTELLTNVQRTEYFEGVSKDGGDRPLSCGTGVHRV